MFDIEYKGGNSVLVTTKDRQLLIDGNMSLLGLKDVKVNDVVNLATEKRFLPTLNDESLVLEGPGEYEVGPFTIRGVAVQRMLDSEGKKSTLYRVEIGDVVLGVIGNIAAHLDDEQLESLGVVDIVIIPIGGNGYTLDASDAAKLIRQIEPKIVIPVHYEDPGLSYEVPQESIERFERELAVPIETVAKLKFKSSASLPAALTLVKLSRA